MSDNKSRNNNESHQNPYNSTPALESKTSKLFSYIRKKISKILRRDSHQQYTLYNPLGENNHEKNKDSKQQHLLSGEPPEPDIASLKTHDTVMFRMVNKDKWDEKYMEEVERAVEEMERELSGEPPEPNISSIKTHDIVMFNRISEEKWNEKNKEEMRRKLEETEKEVERKLKAFLSSNKSEK